MENYKLIIDDEGVKINNILINEKIFQEEKVEYSPREREDEIEHLCMWISESKSQSDKTLMLNDLKYLMSLEDEFIFSSISTNKYITKSDDLEGFNNICREILDLNEVKVIQQGVKMRIGKSHPIMDNAYFSEDINIKDEVKNE